MARSKSHRKGGLHNHVAGPADDDRNDHHKMVPLVHKSQAPTEPEPHATGAVPVKHPAVNSGQSDHNTNTSSSTGQTSASAAPESGSGIHDKSTPAGGSTTGSTSGHEEAPVVTGAVSSSTETTNSASSQGGMSSGGGTTTSEVPVVTGASSSSTGTTNSATSHGGTSSGGGTTTGTAEIDTHAPAATSHDAAAPAPIAATPPAAGTVTVADVSHGGGGGGGGGGGSGSGGPVIGHGLNHDSLSFLLDSSHYRAIDGTGNNTTSHAPNGVDGGAVGAEYVRLTPAHYQNNDGSTPMHTHLDPDHAGSFIADTGPGSENARDISNAIAAQGNVSEPSAEGLNDLFWAYGQWVDHGLDLQPDGGPGKISIPTPDDPNFPDIGITRTSFEAGTGTDGAHPREYTNPLTSFEDASQLYGSEQWLNDLLRDQSTGRMMSAQAAQSHGFGAAPTSNDHRDLLPTWGQFKNIALAQGYTIDTKTFSDGQGHVITLDTGSVSKGGDSHAVVAGGMLAAAYFGKNPGHFGVQAENDLFVSGDVRVNENSALTTLHTLFLREHNYQVDRLASQYHAEGTTVTKDQIFNAAKIMVEGEYQHIINQEFLPAMLGHKIEKHDFDPHSDPNITLEFSTAAYRFGHSMLSDSIERLGPAGQHVADLTLGAAFINPYELNNAAGNNMQGIIKGLNDKVAQNMDEHFVDTVRNGLLGAQDDLFARNLERSRDHGIGTMNEVREALGLHAYTSWDEFSAHMVHPENVDHFKQVYASINDVDLYAGGLAEEHVGGGTLGETFNFIVEKQFTDLHNGDVDYYLNRFQGQLLSDIKGATLQTLFARDFGVNIGSDAFHGHTIPPDHII